MKLVITNSNYLTFPDRTRLAHLLTIIRNYEAIEVRRDHTIYAVKLYSQLKTVSQTFVAIAINACETHHFLTLSMLMLTR